MMTKKGFCLLLATALSVGASAQDKSWGKLTFTGSVQSDVLIPVEITKDMPEHFLTNTYADLRLMNRHLEVGVRLEYLDHPLPGFEDEFKGWGVPNIYAKLNFSKWDLTLGSFYEQFGSGFILRTYEERSLGVDNSLLGARFGLRPYKGISLKVLSGMQRNYWEITKHSLVSGADAQLNLDEWIPKLAESGTVLAVGGSFVNKYEDDYEDKKDEWIYLSGTHYHLRVPKFVNAWDARVSLQTHGFNVLAEYARKGADPNNQNGFIYKEGDVAMLSASYTKKGLSVLLQAKRSDNMSFRSERANPMQTPVYINHLPAFTMDHTYALAALYPYATNPNGEWAWQGEVAYKFKRGTTLGGKYGTNLKLNVSYVRAIDATPVDGGGKGTDGYKSSFFKVGDKTYYQDINVQFEKKFSKLFKLNLMYMNQRYNQLAVEKHGEPMIHSNIFVADAKFQFNRKTTLRAEAQYLNTKDDVGDWVFGLLELSLAPHWMLTVSDQWNVGETDEHYYQGSVTFNWDAHRLQVGYGRTREGLNCTGGVCRRVPETKGVTLSYNYNF